MPTRQYHFAGFLRCGTSPQADQGVPLKNEALRRDGTCKAARPFRQARYEPGKGNVDAPVRRLPPCLKPRLPAAMKKRHRGM